MKKFAFSSVALFGLTVGAMAADMPKSTPAPAPVTPAPVFTWTGFYLGVNAGYGFSNRRNDDCFGGCGFSFRDGSFIVPTINPDDSLGPPAPIVPTAGSVGFGVTRRNKDGFVGGGQIGYNYQFVPGSGFVIGIEADAQYADFRRSRSGGFFSAGNAIFTANPILPAGTFIPSGPGIGVDFPLAASAGNVALFDNAFGNRSDNRGIDWFGTVRGRLGYGFDRLLIYVTGGAAYTDRSDRCFDGAVFNGGVGCGGFVSGTAVPAPFYVTSFAATAGANISATRSFFFTNGHARRDDEFGWAVGGGAEFAFTDNVTAKLEGLYINFNDRRGNFPPSFAGDVVGVTNTGAAVTSTGFGFLQNRRSDDFAVIRAGLNYKFTTF